MPEIRHAQLSDAEAINNIGNHYIQHSAANFKLDLLTLEERRAWIGTFSDTGRYQLLVTEWEGQILGYAGTSEFHERCAYQTSVATMVYIHPDNQAKGLATQLYTELFKQLKGEDIHRFFAGITLPNPASVALHRKFGFQTAGLFSQAGRKFDQYWDVLWMEKPFESPDP